MTYPFGPYNAPQGGAHINPYTGREALNPNEANNRRAGQAQQVHGVGVPVLAQAPRPGLALTQVSLTVATQTYGTHATGYPQTIVQQVAQPPVVARGPAQRPTVYMHLPPPGQ
jgi:hypothetical protein